MKILNHVFGLLLMTVLVIPFCSCQINSAEQVADSLALQLKSPNELAKSELVKAIDVINQRNALAEELIRVIDKSTNGATIETKELALSLKKFKSLNLSNEVIVKELYKQRNIISKNIADIFILANTKKIDNSSFQNIQMSMEKLENRVMVQCRQYNCAAQSYNFKIEKDANSKFFNKYPNLGIKKPYFEPDLNSK